MLSPGTVERSETGGGSITDIPTPQIQGPHENVSITPKSAHENARNTAMKRFPTADLIDPEHHPSSQVIDITSHGIYSNVPRHPKRPGHMRIRVQLLEPNRRIRTRAMDSRQTDHQTTQRDAPTASSD